MHIKNVTNIQKKFQVKPKKQKLKLMKASAERKVKSEWSYFDLLWEKIIRKKSKIWENSAYIYPMTIHKQNLSKNSRNSKQYPFLNRFNSNIVQILMHMESPIIHRICESSSRYIRKLLGENHLHYLKQSYA
jgi:hypothetical protein